MGEDTVSDRIIPAVQTTSWHDKHSGRSLKAAAYYDEDAEDFDCITWCPRSRSENPTLIDAPDEHVRMWEQRTRRRDKARKEVKRLLKVFKRIRTCPVCGENMTRVRKDSVVRHVFDLPNYENPRDYTLMWCPDCGANAYKKGDYHYASGTVDMDIFEHGAPSAHISIHYSARQDRKKGKMMATADKYLESLQSFAESLMACRAHAGVIDEDVLPHVGCAQCGDTVMKALAAPGGKDSHVRRDGEYPPEGPYCSTECRDDAW